MRTAITNDTRCSSASCVIRLTIVLAAIVAFWRPLHAQPEARPGRDSTRPMSEAVLEIQQRSDVAITYEDPILTYHEDLVDVTKLVRRDGKMSSRVIVARAPKVALVDPGGDPIAATQALVDQFNRAVPHTRFRVLVDGDQGVHVIPAVTRNISGRATAVTPLFDILVELPAEAVLRQDLVDSILAQVTATSGTRCYLGSGPFKLLLERIGPVDRGGPMPARAALTKVLKAMDGNWSWSLLCSPTPLPGECALNIRRVPAPRSLGTLR